MKQYNALLVVVIAVLSFSCQGQRDEVQSSGLDGVRPTPVMAGEEDDDIDF